MGSLICLNPIIFVLSNKYIYMRDTYDILSTTPEGEKTAQTGFGDYHRAQRIEAVCYIDQLRRTYGDLDSGVDITIKTQEHDFGSYITIQLTFDDQIPGVWDQINQWDQGLENWDGIALEKLKSMGYFDLEGIQKS